MMKTLELRRPIANSYWVKPGQFLAGEYPRDQEDLTSRKKLNAFLDAGVVAFLDLTTPGELEPYEPMLREEAGKRGLVVHYERFPVTDVSVPPVHEMGDILKRIDNWLTAGVCIYVHCWGGVGRTGTVVGCYFVEQGMTGEEALAELAKLWHTVSPQKRKRRPKSPETDEQVAFVKKWDPTR